MLGYFPAPHPEELLYSACARYSDLMRFPNTTTAAYRFFGKRGITAAVDLPSGLDHLISVIPHGHHYTVDRLVKDHTLEPFYAAFLPLERLRAIQDDMRGSSGNHIYTRLGINIRKLKRPGHLRFCPTCVLDDRGEFGEAYWHRIHQVDGVEVCPQHEVLLEVSRARCFQRNSGNVVPAESAVIELPSRRFDLSNPKT